MSTKTLRITHANMPDQPLLPDASLKISWGLERVMEPQHMQELERRLEQASSPPLWGAEIGWGISELKVNEARLKENQLEIESCDLRFQQNTHILFPGNAEFKPLDLPDEIGPGGLPIFLVLSGYGSKDRWRPQIAAVPHEDVGTEFVADIEFKCFTPRLTFERDWGAEDEVLLLTVLHRGNDGALRLDMQSSAILKAGAFPELIDLGVRLVTEVKKQLSLARARLPLLNGTQARDETFLLQKMLLQQATRLKRHFQSDNHPWLWWVALTELQTALDAFDLTKETVTEHGEYPQGDSAKVVFAAAQQAMMGLGQVSSLTRFFQMQDDGVHVVTCEPVLWRLAKEVRLATPTCWGSDDHESPLLCRKCELERIRTRRLPGLVMERVEAPGQDSDGVVWRRIVGWPRAADSEWAMDFLKPLTSETSPTICRLVFQF